MVNHCTKLSGIDLLLQQVTWKSRVVSQDRLDRAVAGSNSRLASDLGQDKHQNGLQIFQGDTIVLRHEETQPLRERLDGIVRPNQAFDGFLLEKPYA